MIIITGAAGFIGSCLVKKLNQEGHQDLILVDDFSKPEKQQNLSGKACKEKLHRDTFINCLHEHANEVELIYHIGARTDTTEFDTSIFDKLNLNYSKALWEACAKYQIPLVYASSAATYGIGDLGYQDDHAIVNQLQPLNPYGISKNEFDKWALQQTEQPPFWAGLKFFNVYGPNEYHKGRMASVIFHAFKQIKEKGQVRLFRSHHPEFKDGEQLRDFIYVKDIIEVCHFLKAHRPPSGLYNLGTGKARTFLDLAQAVFHALGQSPNIQFIDTPEDIRDKYQYYTQADMAKLLHAGYDQPFTTLEKGVHDYVQNYLSNHSYL